MESGVRSLGAAGGGRRNNFFRREETLSNFCRRCHPAKAGKVSPPSISSSSSAFCCSSPPPNWINPLLLLSPFGLSTHSFPFSSHLTLSGSKRLWRPPNQTPEIEELGKYGRSDYLSCHLVSHIGAFWVFPVKGLTLVMKTF